MLLSTSRKPSQQTRSFCKNLSRIYNFDYVNRGKMSMRDLFLNSNDELNYIALVYETKGNPSKISFFSKENTEDGNGNANNEVLAMSISNNSPSKRLNFDKNNLFISFDFVDTNSNNNINNNTDNTNTNTNNSIESPIASKLKKLAKILDLELSQNPNKNYIHIEELSANSNNNNNSNNNLKNIAIINFIDKNGEESDFNIFIKRLY